MAALVVLAAVAVTLRVSQGADVLGAPGRRSVCHDGSLWAAGVTAAGYLPGGSGQCRCPGPGESDRGSFWTFRFLAARPTGPMDFVLELGDEELRDDGCSGFRADDVALAGEAVQPPAG